MAAGAGSYTDPYPTYPDHDADDAMDFSPSQPSGPGTRHVSDTPTGGRPYPTYGEVAGTDKAPPSVPSTTATQKYGSGAGSYSNPYPIHGIQYALSSAMGAPKNVTHFQNGDIRHADDMSGGNPIERANPGPNVAAVSAALDKQIGNNKAKKKAADQTSAFKQAAKGAKAGRPAKDMKLRHAGTQADVNSASTGY